MYNPAHHHHHHHSHSNNGTTKFSCKFPSVLNKTATPWYGTVPIIRALSARDCQFSFPLTVRVSQSVHRHINKNDLVIRSSRVAMPWKLQMEQIQDSSDCHFGEEKKKKEESLKTPIFLLYYVRQNSSDPYKASISPWAVINACKGTPLCTLPSSRE